MRQANKIWTFGNTVLFLILFFICFPIFSENKTIDHIYVNANIGQSAGGHTALRINDTVYHFQFYPDGLFRLVRDDWEEFRYIYNILDNRTITINHISLSEENFEIIKETFNRYYLIQQKHIQNVLSLRNDIYLLNAFEKNNTEILLAGKGYFSDFESSDALDNISSTISQKHGADFLTNQISSLETKLYSLSAMPIDIASKNITSTVYPTIKSQGFSDIYNDTLAKREALLIIQNKKKLKPQSFFQSLSGLPNEQLSDRQLQKLMRIKDYLENEIYTLAANDEPGTGQSLLTSIARYYTIKMSLEQKKLFVLYCYNREETLISLKDKADQKILSEFANEAYLHYKNVADNFFNEDTISSIDFHLLEDAANRNEEIRNGAQRNTPIRMSFDKLLPLKPETTKSFTPFTFKKENLSKLLENRKASEKEYYQALKKIYNYHLIRKNCVTEIFKTISSAMEDNPEKSASALGGYINPTDFPVFIPFVSSSRVKNIYHVNKTTVIPSYRIAKLRELKKSHNFLIELRESNTLSSKIYRFNQDDSLFIFFTDHNVAFRPLFGIINLGAGIAQTTWGILSFPFNRGEQLNKGIRGIFFSLPELAFINIRKGSFQFVKITEIQNPVTSNNQ